MVPLEKLLALLPASVLDRLAVDLEVNKCNQVTLPGQVVFLCLLNTVVNSPVVTQALLAEHFTRLTGQTVDSSSFGKCLTKLPPAYFEAIFRHLRKRLEPNSPAPATAPSLRIRRVDATTVTISSKLVNFGLIQRAHGRAKNQTAKRHVKTVMTLSAEALPDLLHVCQDPAENNDNCALGPALAAATEPGDLWLFDRGCKDRDWLLTLHRRGSFWLTPHCGQSWRVLQEVWRDPAAPDAAAAARADLAAQATAQPKSPAPYRLLRVTEAVFENAEDARQARRQAQWAEMPLCVFHGERFNRRTQAWEPFVLHTNLPLSADKQQVGGWALAEVPELYRLRWEMEVFFKFLKQHVSYAHLVSFHENGIRLMLWIALIAALLLDWYRKEAGITRGWRSVKFWLAEAAREWLAALLAAVRLPRPLRRGGGLNTKGLLAA